jgi:hypothetical protein
MTSRGPHGSATGRCSLASSRDGPHDLWMANLDASDRAALAAEWQRQAAEPLPTTPFRTIGCASAIAGVALLLGIPPLFRAIGVSLQPGVGVALAVVLVAVTALGALVGVFVGSGRYAAATVRVEEALAWLAAHPEGGDAAERRRFVVALLLHAYVSDGPSMSSTYDPSTMATRLGPALPYVRDAERALREELSIGPVFTSEPAP